jgi:hypothetical protein
MNGKSRNLACLTCGVTLRSQLRAVLIAFLLLGCSSLLLAQAASDFTRIYDSYLEAVKSGSYSRTSAYLSAEMRDQLKTPEIQKEYMETMKLMAPIHYETEFINVSKDGQTADVDLIVTIAVPEQVQKEQKLPPTQHGEMVLKFVREGGQWKMGPPLLLGDPDKRARPKDLNMGSRADYAEGASTEVGGVVLKMEKQASGTVFVLRLPDQEIAVFVPAAKVLDGFVPGSILVVHGAENKTDKLKLWAEDAALYQEPASQ